MPAQNYIRRSQWQLCDRCGLMYPLTQLTRQQGLTVCTRTCTDNLDNQYRPKQIAEVLATPGEGTDERSELLRGPGEVVIF
jgi:hypothetical protein